MREEYKAIIDAGLILQLDDPSIAENWDMVNPEPSTERISQIHHGPGRGVESCHQRPAERPHSVPFVLGQLARPACHRHSNARHRRCHAGDRCAGYSFEAANVRHEHEWRVWRDIKPPSGKILIPGIVSHATNVVEHPELVCRPDRSLRQPGRTRERHRLHRLRTRRPRVHPDIAWAKLKTLARGRRTGDEATLVAKPCHCEQSDEISVYGDSEDRFVTSLLETTTQRLNRRWI
jgi:5-methyltetrahydropteroyltriglutamate--homocysteine methyltransferase